MSAREPEPAPESTRDVLVELAVFWLVRVAGAAALVLLGAGVLGLAVRIFVAAAGVE